MGLMPLGSGFAQPNHLVSSQLRCLGVGAEPAQARSAPVGGTWVCADSVGFAQTYGSILSLICLTYWSDPWMTERIIISLF